MYGCCFLRTPIIDLENNRSIFGTISRSGMNRILNSCLYKFLLNRSKIS